MRHHLGKKAGSLASAVGLVVAGMALPAGAANLLINPGFESPTDSSGSSTDSTITDWSIYGSILRANFENHTPGGEWSVWEQTFQSYGGVYQNVGNITVGATYNLSAYYYFESAEPTIPNEVSDLALSFLNSSGGVINADANGYTDETDIPSSSVTTTGAWLPYSVSGVAPAGAVQVQVSFDFENGSTVTGQQAAFVDDADLEGPGIPPTVAQWAVNNSGNWNSNGNWTTGSVPNAVGEEADFFSAITALQTVYTNSAITEGTLHFNNANEYVIAGAPALTLQTTSGNAAVLVDQGTDELDLPVVVASNTVFTVATGANLIVANPITINSGKTLTQSGGGTVTYQSIITVGTSASIAFGNSTYAHQLSLASGSTASVGGSKTVLQLDSLTNSGTLDVENNEVIINYGSSTDPIATVRAELISGRAGGAWNGTGIDSSTAALSANNGHYAVGYADGADHVVAGLSSGQIEIKYTLLGDANLDGLVSGDDFTILVGNLGKTVSGWDKGDFLYTGLVTGDDFTALVANLGKQSNGSSIELPASDYAAVDAFAAANGLMADVPEPTSLGLLGLAAAGILGRRRRPS